VFYLSAANKNLQHHRRHPNPGYTPLHRTRCRSPSNASIPAKNGRKKENESGESREEVNGGKGREEKEKSACCFYPAWKVGDSKLKTACNGWRVYCDENVRKERRVQ
jgi:hypothetical protein